MLEEATVLPMIMPEFFTGIRRPVKVCCAGTLSGLAVAEVCRSNSDA